MIQSLGSKLYTTQFNKFSKTNHLIYTGWKNTAHLEKNFDVKKIKPWFSTLSMIYILFSSTYKRKKTKDALGLLDECAHP